METIFSKKTNSPNKSTLVSENGNNALLLLCVLAGIGISAVVLYSFRGVEIKGHFVTSRKIFFCVGLLIAATSFVLGVLGGFLFGIPKSITNSTTPITGFIDNDNLVQISDWLTKIIVGVGLTQMIKIPGYLQSLGDYLKYSLGSDTTGSVIATCLVLFFLICGFLMSYLWTRLYFKQMLVASQQDSDNLIEKQEKETALNAVIDEYTESVNSNDPKALEKLVGSQTTIVQDLQKEGKTQSLSPVISLSEFNALIDKANQKMQNGLLAQNSISSAKKDPNKNQWGGKSENNRRKISASVNRIDGSDQYKIILKIESTDVQNSPLIDGDTVLFSLHNTYPDPFKLINVKNGVAKLEVISYGAYTVGAYINKENIELELDLAQLPDAPKGFKEN